MNEQKRQRPGGHSMVINTTVTSPSKPDGYQHINADVFEAEKLIEEMLDDDRCTSAQDKEMAWCCDMHGNDIGIGDVVSLDGMCGTITRCFSGRCRITWSPSGVTTNVDASRVELIAYA